MPRSFSSWHSRGLNRGLFPPGEQETDLRAQLDNDMQAMQTLVHALLGDEPMPPPPDTMPTALATSNVSECEMERSSEEMELEALIESLIGSKTRQLPSPRNETLASQPSAECMLGAGALTAGDDGPAAATRLQAASREAMVLQPLTVIFLDIDGVICTSKEGNCVLRTNLLRELQRIVVACDAKVVLSSDWRRTKWQTKIATERFAREGITCWRDAEGNVGATPEFSEIGGALLRPKEIAAWLREHGQDVTRWVAIDDRLLTDEDGGDLLVGHCVTTEFAKGLTAERADEAIQLLQGQ